MLGAVGMASGLTTCGDWRDRGRAYAGVLVTNQAGRGNGDEGSRAGAGLDAARHSARAPHTNVGAFSNPRRATRGRTRSGSNLLHRLPLLDDAARSRARVGGGA